jgi:hypothetical protein
MLRLLAVCIARCILIAISGISAKAQQFPPGMDHLVHHGTLSWATVGCPNAADTLLYELAVSKVGHKRAAIKASANGCIIFKPNQKITFDYRYAECPASAPVRQIG